MPELKPSFKIGWISQYRLQICKFYFTTNILKRDVCNKKRELEERERKREAENERLKIILLIIFITRFGWIAGNPPRCFDKCPDLFSWFGYIK